MNDVAIISTVQEYIDEYLFEPSSLWPEREFAIRCYSRWAADEIVRRMMLELERLSPDISIYEREDELLDLIAIFVDEMDAYYEESDDDSRRFIFAVARETGNDILYLFE